MTTLEQIIRKLKLKGKLKDQIDAAVDATFRELEPRQPEPPPIKLLRFS